MNTTAEQMQIRIKELEEELQTEQDTNLMLARELWTLKEENNRLQRIIAALEAK